MAKAHSLEGFLKSTEVLAEFPRQVVLAKTIDVACGLRGKKKGLRKRLTDGKRTRSFRKWCGKRERIKRGEMSFSHDKAREEALAHVSALVEGADSIKGDLRAHAEAHFTAEELAILRGGKPFTDAMTAKLIDAVFEFAYKFFEAHQNWVKLPSTQELPYTFIFRYALCAYLHALHWIAAGGGQDRKQDKFGNDMIDVAMATYATCFDGFLSKDKLAMEIYDNAKFLLENGFLREDLGMLAGGFKLANDRATCPQWPRDRHAPTHTPGEHMVEVAGMRITDQGGGTR